LSWRSASVALLTLCFFIPTEKKTRHPADLAVSGVKVAVENPLGSTSKVFAFTPSLPSTPEGTAAFLDVGGDFRGTGCTFQSSK
jgi:hypothetical protein